jgi:hypothetical protein
MGIKLGVTLREESELKGFQNMLRPFWSKREEVRG